MAESREFSASARIADAVRLMLVAGSAAALAGCASLGRMESYGNRLADAKTQVDGHAFSLWVHPTEDTIMVQRGMGGALGQGAISGLTFGAVDTAPMKPIWRRAAEWLTAPLGCSVTDAYSIDNKVTWEAPYACPAGVDLRKKVAEQRTSLRAGEPIKP